MRERKLFNDNWVFYGKEGEERVTLPHTWNREDGYSDKLYLRGVFTYKKEFQYSLSQGRRLFIEFEGVNSSSRVSINGVELGGHDGGYSTFRFDITPYIKEHNVMEVVVDNTPNDRVYPQKADFTFYGGIYRSVYLVETDEVHFPLLSYGGPGVKVTTKVQGQRGILSFSTSVEGDGDLCRVNINDTGYSFPVINGEVEGEVEIDNVHLWNGLEDPYLYPVSFSLEKNGEERDEIELKVGFRTIEIDSGKGFFLNGRSYPLRGVSRHQDRWGKGNAIDERDEDEDMDIILDSGANSMRLAHYQHSQHFYDLCDEKGLLVWAEIPFITVFMENGKENTLSQMKELVVQNIHHPSIFCWALSNEITLQGVTDSLIENHRQLNELCHELDPGRYTAMANLFMLETSSPLLSIPDIIGYNIYYGWYVGDLSDNEEFLDRIHREHPEYRVAITEYGADASVYVQSPCPERGDYSEGYQALYHTHMAALISSRPWLWGSFVWNMFDFGASGRNEAGDTGKNHKGLVTFDRKVRKDAYWLYASYWRKKSFVYIAGRRYRNRVEEDTEVKVYSNSEEVELFVDGKSIGKKNSKNVFSFTFKISGLHLITAKNREGDQDTIERHYSPPSLKGVCNIGIDEFAVKKGNIYKTIVVDLDTGRTLYVGDGKGVGALKSFWKRVKLHNVQIKHVATDLSVAFISSVLENCPEAVHVFDHFHVVKLMNDHLDDIRRKVYAMEKDVNKRKVLKGTRYLLLCNGEDIFDKQHKTRLDNALAMNEPLSKAYYLKEQLKEIWAQVSKTEAEAVLDDWVKQAHESKTPQLMKMAGTLLAHKRGILAWYDCHISTGKVEGINNKIKVMKRNAYGFRDDRYFTLRLYALHDCRITRNVG